jgi:hypothetical protein
MATENRDQEGASSALITGWTANSKNSVIFVERLISRALSTHVEMVEVGENYAVLRFSLDAIHFRHFHQIYCIVLGGPIPDRGVASNLKYQWSGDDRFIMVVLPLDSWEPEFATTFSARTGFLMVCLEKLQEIGRSADPIGEFMELVLSRISRHRLNPFSTLAVPAKNMFFGREESLELLFQADATSWAVAGPGRIGKSSLIQHYIRLLRELDPVRKQTVFYTDFYYLDTIDEDAISRHIARAINDNRRAQEITLSTIKRFIMIESRGRRLELLFDEVDRVCHTQAFLKLAELAKDGVCRLVFCGKAALYESLHNPEHQLHGRLQHLHLLPMSFEDSQRLFLLPLIDLGFRFTDEERIMHEIYRDTSGYPHLIQHLGSTIVRFAIEELRVVLDFEFVEKVRNHFDTAQFFVAPIHALGDDRLELIALSLLHDPIEQFTESHIRRTAEREGLQFDAKRISEVARSFYINNIVSWDGTYFRIATGGLRRFARKLGYFVPRLLELRKKVGRLARAARDQGD